MSLQRMIDKTLPVRKAAFRFLDRRGLRGVLGGGVSVYSLLRRGRGVWVTPENGLWVHRFADGYLVNRVIDTTLLETIDYVARDTFLHGLTVSPGDVVVDVGAGVGTEVLTFSRLAGPGGRVLAIEAHPETARALQRTVMLNRLRQVEVIAAAATAKECELSITDDEDHIKSQVRSDASSGAHRVPGRPLATLLRERGIERIDLVKMNIEGAELDALRGMGAALANVRQVAISCHDFLAPESAPHDWRRTFDGVRELLSDAGFELWTREADERPWVRHTWYGRRRT